MDGISSIRLPEARPAGPRAAAAASAQAPPADPTPVDTVRTSSAPAAQKPSGRAWLWTGLATAGLLGGTAVGGPLGAVLTAQQKAGLREVLGDLQASGVKFFVDRGMLGGIFSSRHQEQGPDGVMALLEADKPEFETKLWMKREGTETQKVRSLGHLQELDAFYGPGDAAGMAHPHAARGLKNLVAAGWSIHTVANSWDISPENRTGPVGLWRDLTAGGHQKVSLVGPDGKVFNGLKLADLGPLDFWEGTGDPASLEHPDLAVKLREVEARGFELQAEGWEHENKGLRGSYQALAEGGQVHLRLGGIDLGTVQGKSPSDVDAALATAKDLVDLHDGLLKREVEAGRLDGSSMGPIMAQLRREVPGHSLQARADLFLELARAVRSGPDRKESLPEQTGHALGTWRRLLERGEGGEEFAHAVTLASGLIAQVGTKAADTALRHLVTEIPKSSPFPEARREREATYLRLMRALGNPAAAAQAAPLAEVRLGTETLEDRLKAMEALARAGRHQAGWTDLQGTWLALLAHRLPEQSLEDAASACALLLGGLARAGKAEETAATFRLLQEGLRHGHFPDESSSAVVDRFLSTLLLTRDPEEARQKMLEPVGDDGEPGRIEKDEGSVNVGGIVLPVKQKPAEA